MLLHNKTESNINKAGVGPFKHSWQGMTCDMMVLTKLFLKLLF